MLPQDLDELKKLAQEGSVEEKLKAIEVLSTYDFDKSLGIIETLIHAVESDKDTSVRRRAAAALGDLKAIESRDILLRLMKTDENIRGWAALALGRIGGDGVYEELLNSYHQEPYHITQWMLLEALKTMKDSRCLPLFQEILSNWLLVDQKVTALWGVYELLGEASLPIVATKINDFHGSVAQSTVANVAIAVLEAIDTQEAKAIVSEWKALYRPDK